MKKKESVIQELLSSCLCKIYQIVAQVLETELHIQANFSLKQILQQVQIDRMIYFVQLTSVEALQLIERKPTKQASIFLVFRKIIKRIKRLINALNFVLIHQRTNATDMSNICT